MLPKFGAINVVGYTIFTKQPHFPKGKGQFTINVTIRFAGIYMGYDIVPYS